MNNNKATLYTFNQIFKNNYGMSRLIKTADVSPGSEYTVRRSSYEQAVYELLATLNVQPKIENTGILSVNGLYSNPYLAADIVNGLMTEYDNLSTEQANNNLEKTINFMDNRISLLTTDIAKLKTNLLAYQKANGLVNATQQLGQQLGTAASQESAELEHLVALTSLEQIESYMRSKSPDLTGVIAPSDLGIGDATLSNNIQKYNNVLAQKRGMVESNVTRDNPVIGQLDKELESLRALTIENINVLKKGYQKSRQLAASVRASKQGQALNMPAKISEQADLEYQLNLKQTLFKMLSEKKEEAAISRASYVSSSLILDKARPELNPATPQKGRVKLAGILIGLLAALSGITLKKVADNKINSADEIQRVTDAPLVGQISHSKAGVTLSVSGTSRSLISEQFRMIRTNMEFIAEDNDKNVILVTSSFSSEGKSFISTNLAAAFALTDKKTVILELDMRKPAILKGLDIPDSKVKGISNYIVSDVRLDEIIIPVPNFPNLSVIPCGPIPPNPSELLLRDKTKILFTELRKKFDYIIIDSAPIEIVSDAFTLAKFADCTLFVVRQRQTLKRQLRSINDLYKNGRLKNLGIVLNDIELKRDYYGRYGNYGYYTLKKGMDYYEKPA